MDREKLPLLFFTQIILSGEPDANTSPQGRGYFTMATKAKKRKNNVKFLNDFMQWGSPLNQIFVMDAIGKLANMVIDQQDQLRIDMKDNFVHPESWIQCAKDWKRDYDENYND